MLKPLLIFLSIIYSSVSNAEMKFWLLDEYLQKQPAQEKLMDQFAMQIHLDAIPLQSEQNQPISIAIIYPSRQISDYWRRSVIAFEARLTALNIKYKLRVHETKMNQSTEQQTKLLQKALLYKPDFLVLTLDESSPIEFIGQIIKDKKSQVIVQNITTPLIAWAGQEPLLYVGFDHVTGTQLLADYFKDHFTEGKFAVNNYYQGYISQMRGDSFVKMMQQVPELELTSYVYTNGTQGDAYHFTEDLVHKHPDINFIYAASTDIALGTSKALAVLGRQDILVSGWGGGGNEIKALQANQLSATAMRMNDDNSVAMAEAIKLVLEGKSHAVPVVYSGSFELVTSKMDKAQLDVLIKLAFRYSN